jgi:hypothetical protein
LDHKTIVSFEMQVATGLDSMNIKLLKNCYSVKSAWEQGGDTHPEVKRRRQPAFAQATVWQALNAQTSNVQCRSATLPSSSIKHLVSSTCRVPIDYEHEQE